MVAALLYAPFLDHPFQYDDDHTIVQNPALRQPDAWRTALTGSMPASGEVPSGHYRPLAYLTYWLTLRLAGPAPLPFHAVNLALHLIAARLLFVLVRDLVGDGRAAILAGALFALHPLASEAVLYASARAGLLAAVFALGALLCYVRARQRQMTGRSAPWRWTAWAATGLGALLSKETSVVLPLLCLAVDRVVIVGAPRLTRWARWGPHAAAWGALSLFVLWLGPWRHAAAALAEPHALERYLATVANQASAIGMAIRLFIFPWPLSIDHPIPAWLSAGSIALSVATVAWCVGSLGAFLSRAPVARCAGFFALWVVIVALPTTLWPLNVPFQEHRAHLQLAALAALVGLGVISLLDAGRLPRKAAAGFGLAALIASAVLITGQGRRWSDPVRLWDHARATAPASFRAHANAGLALAAAGRWDEADAAVTASLALNPDYPPALVARGVMAYRSGNRAAAMADYRRAAALRPQYVPALYNLGLLAQEGNDPAAAEQWYRRALAVNPLHSDTLLNLGALLVGEGRMDEAGAVLATARSVSPDSPEVLYYSGVVAERQGHRRDAETYYREARRIAGANGREALAADANARLTALEADP